MPARVCGRVSLDIHVLCARASVAAPALRHAASRDSHVMMRAGTCVADTGATSVAAALKVNSALTTLNLAGTLSRDVGRCHVIRALSRDTCIVT